jgi:hypothetical protein
MTVLKVTSSHAAAEALKLPNDGVLGIHVSIMAEYKLTNGQVLAVCRMVAVTETAYVDLSTDSVESSLK